MLTLMPVVCDADANGITRQKSHDAANFSCLTIRNAVVPLMMLATYDTDASASGI